MFFIAYLTFFVLNQVLAENCITPNNETAPCILLFDCPIILNAIQTQEKAALDFYSNSTCGGTADKPMVCCGTSSAFIKKAVTVTTNKLMEYEISCGFQHSDDFYHTINNTALSEFPWFAKIKERSKSDTSFSFRFFCSGTLITVKHVLTAASCITDEKHVPGIVRLGEYNILNKFDCAEDSQVEECNEEVKDFGIDEMIPHPNYEIINNIQRINDIGLIKLNGSVRYSDYIRPICLPFADIPKIVNGDELITIRPDRSLSNVKPKLTRKFMAKEECQTKFPKYLPLFMHAGHICGTHLNDTEKNCTLNNVGSPVMVSRRYKRNTRWFQIGIVTGNWENCHLSVPDLYTDVNYYFEWIEEHLDL